MPKVSTYTRTRIELLQKEGLHPAGIFKVLKCEGLSVSFPSVVRIVKKLKTTGTLANLPRSGRPSKLSTEAKAFIDQQMCKDDEMTSGQIQKKLEKRGITVSSSTVRRSRKEQGWTLQRTAYCQLIRNANKVQRLEFARQVLESGDTFQNVIFSDECSVSLEQYRRTCYRKIDEPTKRKPRPKHPLKVHVWAGVSRHVPQRFASLTPSWMPISIATSWKPLSFHSLERSFLFTGSCRITTRSIPPDEPRPSSRKIISTGGPPLRKAQT